MQLELLKAETLLRENGIRSAVVVFGGTQIVERSLAEQRLAAAQTELAGDPDNALKQRAVARAERVLAKSHYYDAAAIRPPRFPRCQTQGRCDMAVITGGGPGIIGPAGRWT
jgi:predicted Rossmann-fold nucleotide-binding protein